MNAFPRTFTIGLRRPILFMAAGLFHPVVHAQDVIGFIDLRERMHVFDRGEFREIEPQRPQHMGFGGNYVAYANSIGDLKIYRDGRTIRLDRTDVVKPFITDHLLGFKVASLLKVYDGNELMTLCANTGGSVVEDSVAGWYDWMKQTVNAWYRGETYVLEDALANDPIQDWRSGDNLLAWVTNVERKLKVFYHGMTYDLSDVYGTGIDYKAGADIVAFQDPSGNVFKAFYKGSIIDLEAIMPTSYDVGKGIMAWQDVSGAVKVLESGMIYTATDFAPQEYYVRDSLVVIRDQNTLKVFQGGRIYELQRIWPDEWAASWGTIAYRAPDMTIRIWRNGKDDVALREQTAKSFALDRGLLMFVMPLNAVRIWWRGKVYSH